MVLIQMAEGGVVGEDLVGGEATEAEEDSEVGSGEGEVTTSGGERLTRVLLQHGWRWWEGLSHNLYSYLRVA
jgi:hypothetical protein